MTQTKHEYEYPPIPEGLCQCGCGERTTIWRGKPRAFLQNHYTQNWQKHEVQACGYETPCWIWHSETTKGGYGRLRRFGKRELAHRTYYREFVGPIPDGLHLDHLCSNRACVNPAHLEPVTQVENNRRASRTKLTPEDVRAIRTASESPLVLAERYGVTTTNISAIRIRRTWKDVA